MKIKQDDGTEIEVFTEAEVKAKIDAETKSASEKAVEDFKAANPDKSSEVEKLKKELGDKQQELDDAIKSGANKEQIERLRKERDDAKKAKEDGDKVFEEKFETFKKEMIGDLKEDLLNKAAHGDAELRKKIELEFDNYRPNANSKKDIEERIAKAYQLATGTKPTPNFLDGTTSGGDRGDGNGGGGGGDKKTYNDNEKAIGNVLGVTEADRVAHEKFKKDRENGVI